jgi:hypothetical protein
MKRSVVMAALSVAILVLSSAALARRDDAVQRTPHTNKTAETPQVHASKHRIPPK